MHGTATAPASQLSRLVHSTGRGAQLSPGVCQGRCMRLLVVLGRVRAGSTSGLRTASH